MQTYTRLTFRLFKLSLTLSIIFVVLARGVKIDTLELISQKNLLPQVICLTIAVLAAIRLAALYFATEERWEKPLAAFCEQDALRQAQFLDTIPPAWRGWAILAIAGASLFFELGMIRWQSSLFPVFAFYKNFTLLACFAGLGAGYATAKRSQISLLMALPVTFALVLLLTVLRYYSGALYLMFFTLPVSEQSSVSVGTVSSLFNLIPLYILLSGVFLFTALIFYPIGQACGRTMESEPRLKAYGFNLLGSILGVALMMVVSYLWTPPAIWFVLLSAVILFFLQYDRRALLGGIIASAFLTTAILWPVAPHVQQIHSPYQLIERSAQPNGLMAILAAGAYYQKVYDLSLKNKNRDTDPNLKKVAAYYELPFQSTLSLDRVAVVGAGTGNDVAAALRMGVKQIDAIEIDPVIQYLGWYYHPEKPYSSPRVRTVINDARTFFRGATPGYDLIVYGVLDSHTLLSHLSNVRVDSFVYTKEGMQDAYRLLKDGGILSLSFALPTDALGYKIYQIFAGLPEASKPLAIRVGYDNLATTTFLVKKNGALRMPPALLAETGFADVSDQYSAPRPDIDLPTDDWPFFYMPKRIYPATYLVALGLILALSIYFTRALGGLEKPQLAYMPFFFLGAGFMLVETKAITELGLYFGNTWFVVAIVIIGLLTMAYLANRAAESWRLSKTAWSYLLLFGTLAAGYYVATHGKMDAATPLAYGLVVLLVTSPMFFSGLIFSTLLGRAGQISISPAMAYNLLGALVGGLLEYNSMYFGFAFLYLLAAGLYGMAWLTTRKARA